MAEPEKSFKDYALSKIYELKHKSFGDVKIDGRFESINYSLLLLTEECSKDSTLMDLLGRWRKANEQWYFSQFKVTTERTRNWFIYNLTDVPERLLFIIKVENDYIGHVGLHRFNYDNRVCEIDNILRGEKKYPGIIQNAVISMMSWGKSVLRLKGYALKVLSNNRRAIKLYERIGYMITKEIPLIQKQGKDGLEWVDAPEGYTGPVKKSSLIMNLTY